MGKYAASSRTANNSQGSVVGSGNQGQGNQGSGGRGGGKGRGRNGGGRGRQWSGQGQGYQGQGSQGQGYQSQESQGQGYQGQGSQGQGYQGQGYQGKGYQGQGDQGSQGYGRPRFDWRTAICQHCDQQGHTIRFCNIRREDERSGLISSTMDGDIYDQFGEAIDRRLGGVRAEAQRRAAAGPPPPAMFRLWQEKEEPPFGVEEVGSDEEVTQGLRGGSETEEAIIIESDDEEEEERTEPPSVLFEKMKDLLDKMGSTSQEPPREEHEPGRRKKAVEVEDDDDEEEEDKRLRREEDQRAGQRARKKGIRGEAEPVIQDGPPKKKKYAVRLEEGFDVEKVIDRLLEGHNDLMTLKEILASSSRLRDELKGRLSRRLVPNVHLGKIVPKEAEWAESDTKMDWKWVACGTVNLMVKGSKCVAMVDTGAEMNIIREADAIRFGLDIDRSDCGILHGASCKAMFCGTASNVLVEVGKVKVRACFFIMPDVDHGIVLGRSFLSRTETVMFNKHGGTLILLLCDPAYGNYEIITCRNTGPRSIRNRPNPGSFTIEESGGERRRLWAEPEAGEGVKAFSLSLSDIGKAMDLVAAHEMADPDAIQALSEQVLECPEAGRSDFTKTAMPRGGKGTGPPQRPLGASGGYEQHGPRHRESTSVYNDGDIELFLDSFWEHARRMGWTVAQAIERLGSRPESSRQREQKQPGQGLSGQPSATEPRQEPPMGKVILEPEEARAQRQAEREAFEFRAPTKLATLPVAAAGLVVPLAVEEGLPPSSSEPAQGSADGSMSVLLEAVHTMQEEVSLFSPEQRIEEPLEREMGIEEESAIEGRLQRIGTPEYGPEEIEEQPTAVPGAALERRPQRLDTPKYVPAIDDLRDRLGFWATGSGSGGPVPGTEQQEVVSTTAPQAEQQGVISTLAGSPSSPPPQPRKKKFKRKVDQLCFYCKRSAHHALDCLEFLEDKAAGKISEVGGKMYDRQGRIVEKSADGLRVQLYRQNQEELRR
ncbi:hypothetical protein CBR_g25816 [Chara braunii]|uniref:Peptidase A2 domain-containing protein n=1 Tax=Chara braunii TaxID=69332 RepID=A0A388L6H2_CHABU|nr:hypothetical protein CBR_g25816 [Chara braunii]|eukprot:GBG77884.1 hypothetical protein CBR_g25816 [Chara braunii]